MDASAQQIRLESHVEIGAILQRDTSTLIERWARRAAEEQPHARRVHHDVLLDHWPTFLWQMGRSLAEADSDHNGWHCPPAAEHGKQRWENGWSLAEVVRDYQILRIVILEHLEETLDRSLRAREVMAVGLVLDEAIAQSVHRYALHQEEATRCAERERAEAEKQAEVQWHRREAETLKEVERRKDEFLAVLGHELRTPLASLRNALNVLHLRGDDVATVAWARDVAGRQVGQLSRLVDDLLDASRIGRDLIVLSRERLDLGPLVGTIVADQRRSLESAGLTLTAELPGAPLWISGDPVRLAQVVGNLLSNAAKFTDPGGSVGIRVESSEDRKQAVIEVRDSGIGIPSEMLPHIFEMFMQGDRNPGRSRGGLGIGLTLVRRLVQLHDGIVEAHSDGPGKGCKFTVRLPLALAETAELSGENQHDEVRQGNAVPAWRILVVDDNVDAAESLAMLLQLMGADVRTAYDGPSALKVATAFGADVVFLDIGMPSMDGYEVARRLRAMPQFEKAILVAQTGWSKEEEQPHSRDAGFDHHLVKPFDPAAVQALLASLKPAAP
jgi:signal transduction histidine kinase/ActR/RegA family two-component response regulator